MRHLQRMICFTVVLITIVAYIILFRKVEAKLIIDKIGLTSNRVDIKLDKTICKRDLYIYWQCETDDPKEMDQLLIYHYNKIRKIPPSYGKNYIRIKYNNVDYNNIGLYKLNGSFKHNYSIKLKIENNNLIVIWNIKNCLEKFCGRDTLKLK